jgi:membrane protein required for colicin V production
VAIDGYDLVMLGILLTAAVLGYFKGIVWQLAWIAGIAVSSFAALRFAPSLAPFFGEQAPWNRLLAMLAVYAASSIAVWLVFRVISGLIDAIHLSAFDHQLGLLFGAAKGALLCVVVTFFAVTLAPAYRDQIVTSRSGKIVAELLVRADVYLPKDIHDTVEPYLKRFENQMTAPPGQADPPAAATATGSPAAGLWEGVREAAGWAAAEQGGQGGSGVQRAGGPLPSGSSWFASPQAGEQPATGGGYPVGAQSPLR